MKRIIKEQVKSKTSKIMTKVEKYVTETLGAEVLVRSTNQPQTSYVVASLLSEQELKNILIDKMEENNSIDRSDVQKNLYRALLEAYNSDKDLLSSYGEVVTLKRGCDNQDKDVEPSARSNRGSPPKSSSKSVQEEEHDLRIDDLEEPLNDDVSPTVDDRPPQQWMTKLAQASGTTSSFNEFLATPIDFSAFIMNQLNIQHLTQDLLTGPTYDLIKGTYKSVVELEYHLEEGKLTNLNVDEWFALNVALRMYTRRIVTQERVEDLQLAVESYQKKINLTKPDTYRSDISKKTLYTAYRDIQSIIY
ncbi:hypothetical protein Tco_0005764 [Tanacetum coccineum]